MDLQENKVIESVEEMAEEGRTMHHCVGGPVIVPHSKTIAITPVAPHSLNVRPIVICDDWEITLDVESRSHNFLVAVDGRSESCKETTRLTISRADYSIKVVKRFNHIFFDTLRNKMMWGADVR